MEDTVGGIVDASHAFEGMVFAKLLEKHLHCRLFFFFTNIHGNSFFCKCGMSSMIIVLLQIIQVTA